jgi:hypothetical protein
MPSLRTLAVSFGFSTLLCAGAWPSAPATAQVLERGVEGAAVGAIIGGIIGGGKGAATGAGIGAGIGALSGAAEANARAQGYDGPPPPYGPPPPGYYGPPPRYGSAPHGYYGPPHNGYAARPARAVVAISVAPPPLPVYDQPPCPEPGYVWTPGYWGYAGGGYYWVPGTWVLPPAVGLVWTPGYWGYSGQRYLWNAGYWGPHVGYYGGINYGFGYSGSGYEGGYWDNGEFFYNTAVTRVNTAVITRTYNKSPASTVTVNNVSFNGPGGIAAKPTTQEVAWSQERHTQPTTLQIKHQRAASANRALFAAANHGTPMVAATAKPGVFKGQDVVGPKSVVATTNASAGAGSTGPDGKALPHAEKGTAPAASESATGAVQQTPADPKGNAAPVANGGAAPDQHTPGRPQKTNAAAVNGGAAPTQPGTPAVALGNGGAGPGIGKHALSGPNSPRGPASGEAGTAAGKQAPPGPNGTAVAVGSGGAAPDQQAPGRAQRTNAAAVNGGAAPTQPNAPAALGNGKAGSGIGEQVPSASPGAAAVPDGGATPGQPGRPDAADAAAASGGAGPNQRATGKPNGPAAKSVGGSNEPQGDAKPHVKKNKPDQDNPDETAQSM